MIEGQLLQRAPFPAPEGVYVALDPVRVCVVTKSGGMSIVEDPAMEPGGFTPVLDPRLVPALYGPIAGVRQGGKIAQ